MSYIDDMILHVQQKNATQPEFVQAATEVLDSIRPVVEANISGLGAARKAR